MQNGRNRMEPGILIGTFLSVLTASGLISAYWYGR